MKVGDLLRDQITGLQGVAICRTEWLHGCIRWTLQPRELKDGKPVDSCTFDQEQLELVQTALQMAQADEAKGKAALNPGGTGGDRPDPKRAPDPGR